jgi:5-methylcytosine-specific restriction endonuclease McrA
MGQNKKLQRLRAAIRHRGTNCWICREPIVNMNRQDRDDPFALTLEHIKPRNHGGTSRAGNLALAHRFCNERRSDGEITDELRAECRSALFAAR